MHFRPIIAGAMALLSLPAFAQGTTTEVPMSETVTSKDGTAIAYSRFGAGPALIVVAGATQFRAFDPSLAELGELLADLSMLRCGQLVDEPGQTMLSDVVLKFLEERGPAFQPGSLRSYETVLRTLIRLVGNKPIRHVTRKDMRAAKETLMRRIDEQFLETPFFGVRQMTWHLKNEGHRVIEKRIRRLMRLMGLMPIYQKPNTSKPAKGHKTYPYLLRGLSINRPNQVWAMDITYIPMARGFVFLAAVMDWFSRRVLAWRVSITMDTEFCVEAVEEALARYGPPEIFNTDQGAQYTSEAFTATLKDRGVQISMDGKGRWVDNVFIERLWRSVKYEDVYLRAYETPAALRAGLTSYLRSITPNAVTSP